MANWGLAIRAIKEFIARNQLDKVFALLDEVAEFTDEQQLQYLSIKSRFTLLEKDDVQNRISTQDYKVKRVTISKSLLSFIDSIIYEDVDGGNKKNTLVEVIKELPNESKEYIENQLEEDLTVREWLKLTDFEEYAFDGFEVFVNNMTGANPQFNRILEMSISAVEKILRNKGYNINSIAANYRTYVKQTNNNVLKFDKLKILIQQADATDEEIADILSDISILYRMMGGSGIVFEPNDIHELNFELV